MKLLFTPLIIASILLLNGCFGADTSDPRKGGLFGYSPKNYEARLEERQYQLDELDDEYARAQAERSRLEQTKSAKTAQVASQKKKLAAIDREVNSLSGKIRRAKNNPKVNQQKISRLERRRNDLVKESHHLSGMSNAEREAKIRAMRQELKDLEAEADALSRM